MAEAMEPDGAHSTIAIVRQPDLNDDVIVTENGVARVLAKDTSMSPLSRLRHYGRDAASGSANVTSVRPEITDTYWRPLAW